MKKKPYTISKKILLLLLMAFPGSKLAVMAQSVCDPTLNIITNPANPVNTQTPSLTNHFDWTSPSYSIRSLNYPASTQIENPYFQSWNGNMTPFVISKDMSPNDGWEVIKMDLGYDQNNNATVHTAYNPKVMLYNKYNGTLRVFVARGDNFTPYNSMQIVLKFLDTHGYYRTAALDLAKGVIPLDIPYSSTAYQAVMQITNTPYNWMYADFSIAYDPCTCFYNSLLHVDITYLKTAKITLSGSITGTLTSITDGSGTTTTPDNNSASFNNPFSQASNFIKDYKSVGSFVSDVTKNADSDPFLSAESKTAVKNSINSLSSAIQSNNFLQDGLKSIPYVGAALSFLNFFTGGGKTGPAQVEVMPMAIDMKANLSGSISETYPIENFDFSTPGASISGIDASLYPLYNQTMGVFNLLKTPVLQAGYCTTGGGDGDGSWTESDYYLYRFKQPITYVLNPAAGLSISSVQAALVIEGTGTGPGRSWNGANTNWTYEGSRKDTNTTYHTSTTYLQYRTDYVDAHCLNDLIAYYSFFYASDDSSPDVHPLNYYIKYLVDYQRVGAPAGTQHVLQTYKFPVKKDPNSPYFSDVAGGDSYCYDPTICLATEHVSNPPCSLDMLVAATNSQITDFCHSTTYTNSRAARKVSGPGVTTQPDSVVTAIRFSLSPNPTSRILRVSFHIDQNTSYNIKLYNEMGSLVKAFGREYGNGNISKEIDVTSFPAGMYLFSVEINGKMITRKFIVSGNR